MPGESHSAKQSVRQQSLAFVDSNTQPNGYSSGHTHYFLSSFTTIQIPKKEVANFEKRKRRSIVGEFD